MSKHMNNREIAQLFREMAAAHEVKKEDRFIIRAYEEAALNIDRLSREVKDYWKDEKLTNIPGVGKSLAGYLDELFKTGKVKHFEEIVGDLPKGMFPLLSVRGIGPRTALTLAKALHIDKETGAVEKLKKACQDGKVAVIEGFGEDSEKKFLDAIAEFDRREDRMLLPAADELAEKVIAHLKKFVAMSRIEPLGSLRRRKETIGDIDLAVATDKSEEVLKAFTSFGEWKQILAAGDNTARALHQSGRQVDIKTEPSESFGSLLQHYTGSKEHNVKLREYAVANGLSVSEHGIKIPAPETFKGRSFREGPSFGTKKFKTEEEFYKFLGMQWVPPELREGTDEIALALKHQLPHLVELSDVKGDFHIHSNFNIESSHDLGVSSFDEIVKKAEKLGYEYVAISDHNPSTSKHSEEEVIDLIKMRNLSIDDFLSSRDGRVKIRVFKSLEVDILPDGRRAISDEALELLDFAIVSVHASFRDTAKRQTDRVLAALDHPKVKIFGHPTARQLLSREGVLYEWDRIFEFCAKRNIWLEVNASPQRLDLPDTLIREAIKRGVKLVLGSDSHDALQLSLMPYGVSTLRRGWAEKQDIVNALSYNELKKSLNF